MTKRAFIWLLVALLLLPLAPVPRASATGEIVSTDKAGYEPGETIHVTGSGFTAWTQLPLTILKDGTTLVYTNQVNTDQTGAFATGILAAWGYGNYTLRVGTTASATFAIASAGTLTTDLLYYLVGATGALAGTGFPFGPAKSLAIVRPGGEIKYVLTTQTIDSSFSDTFLIGLDWEPGIYWGRAVYEMESISRTVTTPFTVAPIPPIPTNLHTTAGHNQVSLTWNAVTNPYQGGYKVYRSMVSSGSYTYLGMTTSAGYTDSTAVAFAGSYYYVVTSFDNTPYAHESGNSNEASATPWGDIHHLSFATVSSPQMAGVAFPINITAQDAFNHTAAGYNNPAFLSDTTGTIQPLLFTFTNGVGNPDVTITKAQTGVIITATGSPTGTSNPFDVVFDGLSSITISPTNSTKVAGVAETYTVNAFDIYGNPIGTVTATFTTVPTTGVTITGNQVTASLAGDYAVTAHYNGQTATATLTLLPIVPSSLTISFSLQGAATSYTATFAVSFFEPGGTSPLFSQTLTTPAQAGSFTFAGVTAGTYDIKIKEGRALSALRTSVVLDTGTTTVNFGEQRVGDANGDDVVNILDFALLKASFGKSTGQPGYDPRADFNGDGTVNATDFVLMKSNFGRWGPL